MISRGSSGLPDRRRRPTLGIDLGVLNGVAGGLASDATLRSRFLTEPDACLQEFGVDVSGCQLVGTGNCDQSEIIVAAVAFVAAFVFVAANATAVANASVAVNAVAAANAIGVANAIAQTNVVARGCDPKPVQQLQLGGGNSAI